MGVKTLLIDFIKKQSFEPGFFAIFTNPYFLVRRPLFINIKQMAPKLSGKLLDFGCGRKPYEGLFTVNQYIGIDMEQTGHSHALSEVDVYYDGKHIPFPDSTFDSVFCSEVFEHVFNIDEVIGEIKRVMNKEGKILITVPFCWNEHEVPYDFGRYTSYGIKYLLEQHGFEVLEQRKSGNFFKVNMQLWALYVCSLINLKRNYLTHMLRMLFIVPINIFALLLGPIFPKNKSLFFNNIVLARKR